MWLHVDVHAWQNLHLTWWWNVNLSIGGRRSIFKYPGKSVSLVWRGKGEEWGGDLCWWVTSSGLLKQPLKMNSTSYTSCILEAQRTHWLANHSREDRLHVLKHPKHIRLCPQRPPKKVSGSKCWVSPLSCLTAYAGPDTKAKLHYCGFIEKQLQSTMSLVFLKPKSLSMW